MSQQIKHWLMASSIGCMAIAAIMWTAYWMIIDDPCSLLRYMAIRLTGAITGLITLSGGMLFIDFITPDNWMENIGKNEMASAILMSSVVLVIGAILCWS